MHHIAIVDLNLSEKVLIDWCKAKAYVISLTNYHRQKKKKKKKWEFTANQSQFDANLIKIGTKQGKVRVSKSRLCQCRFSSYD